jgi:quinol monooxygenase YgiN
MIVATVKGRARPEKVTDFLNEIRPLLPGIRAEAGCYRYELFHSPFEPESFLLFEEWADRRAFDQHIDQPHMQAFYQKAAAWFSSAIELVIYDVDSSGSVRPLLDAFLDAPLELPSAPSLPTDTPASPPK